MGSIHFRKIFSSSLRLKRKRKETRYDAEGVGKKVFAWEIKKGFIDQQSKSDILSDGI